MRNTLGTQLVVASSCLCCLQIAHDVLFCSSSTVKLIYSCASFLQTGRYKHHQIWASSSTVTKEGWRRIQIAMKWVANAPALAHVVDGWFATVGVGPLCWHQHIDLASIDPVKRRSDLLARLRVEGGVTCKLPRKAGRPALKAAEASSREVNVGDEAPKERKRKRAETKPNRLERIVASYSNGTWEQRARAIVDKLAECGIAGILPAGKFDKQIAHMVIAPASD